MMVFSDAGSSCIGVLRCDLGPITKQTFLGLRRTLSAEAIGTLIRLSDGQWVFRYIGRNAEALSDILSGAEKRDIIGMLDKLNKTDNRPQSDMGRRWNEIIGLSE